MSQVLTNNTGLAFAIETTAGVLPASPSWKTTEPNTIGSLGANTTLVPRNPISALRQRRKGTIVKLDADLEFEADVTIDSMVDFTESYVHATAVNGDMTFIASPVLATGYTVSSLTAVQAAKLQFTAAGPISLVHSEGYDTSGNNSSTTVFEINATVATSAVLIPVDISALGGAAEASPPSNAEVSIAGIRAEAGDLAIVGIDAELVVAYDTEASGPFVVGETLTFSGGSTAILIILDDQGLTGNLTINLTEGDSVPADNETITGGTSSATAAVNGTPSVAAHTLTSNNGSPTTAIDFTTLGLTAGQTIHVGGLTSTNRFGSAVGGTNDSFGSARVLTIAAQVLTIDKLDSALLTSDGTDTGLVGTEVQVDILFGRFVRNVRSTDDDYNPISFTFEGSYPDLFLDNTSAFPDGFEYVSGCRANQMVWAMPLSDKSSATFGFIGLDAVTPVNNASRKTNASTAREPLFTGAFNTSADFFRLAITDIDDDGLTSDFKDLTATLNNNISGEFILGQVGAAFINNGNFEVTIEGQALFTNVDVATRILANTTVTMSWLLRNDDGAVAVDIPSATINSDGKEFPVNETVRINLTLEAFVDELLDTSIGVSFFPVYPAS